MTKKLTILALVMTGILLTRFSAADASRVQATGNHTPTTPVLVELFTSEGCSDCPPADALLQKLDHSQPVRNAHLVVLSEHVDYWDHTGWRDPYSSHASSERQGLYAQHLNLQTVYTPQMIVNGESEFVGSNEQRALREIGKAARNPSVAITLSAIRFTRDLPLAMHVRIDPLPSGASKNSTVFVGIADEMDESHVDGGENSGRDLSHVAVLRKLAEVGTVSTTTGFERDVTVKVDDGVSDRIRVVAFIQEQGPGRILGVTSAAISK